MNEEMNSVIQKFKTEIEELKLFVREKQVNQSQLKFPLDYFSQKIIKELFVFPIIISLPGISAATAANYGIVFTNNSKYIWEILDVSEVHTTLGTDVGAVSLQLERLQGTEAPDSGDALLGTAFNLKGTINTPQHGTFVADKSLLVLQSRDRICLKDVGTLTAVAGVQVTIYLKLGNLI